MFDPDIKYAQFEYPESQFAFGLYDKDDVLLGYQNRAYIERYNIVVKEWEYPA